MPRFTDGPRIPCGAVSKEDTACKVGEDRFAKNEHLTVGFFGDGFWGVVEGPHNS